MHDSLDSTEIKNNKIKHKSQICDIQTIQLTVGVIHSCFWSFILIILSVGKLHIANLTLKGEMSLVLEGVHLWSNLFYIKLKIMSQIFDTKSIIL